MKIGLTYDQREDYGIEASSEVFADFCSPSEIGYMADAITACGYELERIGNMYRLNEQIKQGSFDCDLVFIADEGIRSRNREAIVPALLELNHIPYVGSDAYAMGLSQNKSHMKLAARALGIRVPKEIYVPYAQPDLKAYLNNQMQQKCLSFPLIVKPNTEGYSMGVFLAHQMGDLVKAIRYNFENYKQEVLVEEYIDGLELYVPIVGSGAFAYVLNIGTCKYPDGSNIEVFSLHDKCFSPVIDGIAPLPEPLKQKLYDWSLRIYRHLNCMDFGRIDYKLDKDANPYFLEINPRPGLTQNGPYETCAKSIGKSYEDIIGEIIRCAAKRQQLKG